MYDNDVCCMLISLQWKSENINTCPEAESHQSPHTAQADGLASKKVQAKAINNRSMQVFGGQEERAGQHSYSTVVTAPR